ncbi:hypothetical protein GOBAR_DD03219 [Gossypium barbadense]|nr:hypothetical protein GOBAR_DD03219 [Gossypium barbadense]
MPPSNVEDVRGVCDINGGVRGKENVRSVATLGRGCCGTRLRLTGSGSSPTSHNIIAGSSAFPNYVGGCGSSPASLNMTDESFVLANYVGGYDSSPMSLNMTAESFTLANCVGGCDSSPVNLNMTAESL